MSTTDKQASRQALAFTVGQPELLAALAFAGKAIPKRTNVPVLTGVVLTGDGKTVTVEAFDYEQARRVVLPGATCTRPGSVLVAASRLTTMVKALPKDRPLALAGEGVKVRLSNGKTTYTIPTMPIEDYPGRPKMPPTIGRIGATVLAGQVAQVAKFIGTDDTVPMNTGIRVSGEGERLSLEATDRYRLAVRDFAWAPAVDKFAALVPGKLLAEVTKAFGKIPDASVTLAYESDGGMIETFGLETDHLRVVTRTLDGGNYPPVRALIPQHPVLDVDLNAAALVEAIRRVEVTAERNTPVLLRFADEALTLETGTTDDGGASETFDECTFVTMTDKDRAAAVAKLVKEAEAQARRSHARSTKEERDSRIAEAGKQVREEFEHATGMTLGANPSYLADVLDLDAARVRMRMVSPLKPFLIVPLDADGAPVPGVTNLLMPIRVTGGAGEPPRQAAVKAADGESRPDGAKEAAVENGAGAADVPQAREADAPAVTDQSPANVAASAPAAGGAALDPERDHTFRRAVEDGTKPNPFTKCTCGRIRNAKVHGGKKAAAKAAAAAVASGQAPAAPDVPKGPIWMAVLQLAARVDGRMVTEATEDGARKAVEQFGYGRAWGVLVAADDNGKRMYVGTRSRDDAELMQKVASAFNIPAHTAQGTWPPTDAATGSGQRAAQEQSPVMVDGEPKFNPRATSIEAFSKVGTGDFEGALALIRKAQKVAPEHRFHDRQHDREYGWDEIELAILAKQVEAEISADAEREALADVAAEAEAATVVVKTGPGAAAEKHAADLDEPQQVAPAAGDEDDAVDVPGSAERPEHPVIVRLRQALAGQPDEVIDAAVSAAMDKMRGKAAAGPSAAGPVPAAAKGKASKKSRSAAPAKPQAVVQQPTLQADDLARWQAFGMVPPSTLSGERVFVLPAGTRLRALRKAVVDAMTRAKSSGAIALEPIVEVDKSDRPYRLRIRFTEPGALTAASVLVNDAVAAALPDVVPARAAV